MTDVRNSIPENLLNLRGPFILEYYLNASYQGNVSLTYLASEYFDSEERAQRVDRRTHIQYPQSQLVELC